MILDEGEWTDAYKTLLAAQGELLVVMWRADFDGEPESFFLFATEQQAVAMFGEAAGQVYAVEIRRRAT